MLLHQQHAVFQGLRRGLDDKDYPSHIADFDLRRVVTRPHALHDVAFGKDAAQFPSRAGHRADVCSTICVRLQHGLRCQRGMSVAVFHQIVDWLVSPALRRRMRQACLQARVAVP